MPWRRKERIAGGPRGAREGRSVMGWGGAVDDVGAIARVDLVVPEPKKKVLASSNDLVVDGECGAGMMVDGKCSTEVMGDLRQEKWCWSEQRRSAG